MTAGAPVSPTAANAEPAYARSPQAVVSDLGSDIERGLSDAEVAQRQSTYGLNEIAAEKPPSVVAVALGQLRDPMNIMLVAVTLVSILIGEVSTGVIVGLLIVLNVVLGSRQELKARASVDALAKLQVPQARVVRDGQVQVIPATDIVPGDVIDVEAGDIIPADGRILRSATLEAQEAALTGESAPIPKGANVLDSTDVGLGDQTNMLFQNTSVTRGTGLDGRDRNRHADPDGSDRHHADHGLTDQIALAEGARLTHQSARPHRLGRGGGNRRRRTDPRHPRPRAAPAGHGDGDLGHPHRAAGLCVGAAVDGREAAGRSQGGREEPH